MKRLLLLDNYDSFTYNLYDYFVQLGALVTCIRNDEQTIEWIEQQNFDAIVISPGPKTPEDAGITMAVIQHFFTQKPILGICLGHQAIGQICGATLVKSKVPVHGKAHEVFYQNHPLFNDIPNPFLATRYHSLELTNLPKSLKCLAQTKNATVMVMQHEHLPITGIQFHPESILTTYGKQLLENWLQTI